MSKKWIDAEAEFESWFTTKQNYCFKFHDARQAMGAGGSRRIFTAAHPSDYIVVDKGCTFFAEVKSSQDEVSFPFASIQKSQWSGAMQTTSASGLYYFFIKSEFLGKWFRVPAYLMINMREQGHKSVKWEHLKPLEFDTA